MLSTAVKSLFFHDEKNSYGRCHRTHESCVQTPSMAHREQLQHRLQIPCCNTRWRSSQAFSKSYQMSAAGWMLEKAWGVRQSPTCSSHSTSSTYNAGTGQSTMHCSDFAGNGLILSTYWAPMLAVAVPCVGKALAAHQDSWWVSDAAAATGCSFISYLAIEHVPKTTFNHCLGARSATLLAPFV